MCFQCELQYSAYACMHVVTASIAVYHICPLRCFNKNIQETVYVLCISNKKVLQELKTCHKPEENNVAQTVNNYIIVK